MRAAWNPAQQVRFRPVGPNLFVVQAACLGDWERMIDQGPWLFRNFIVLMCLYDGFTSADEAVFDHSPIWLTTKKYTFVMIRVCHSRSRFLSCMYIHGDFMTESR